MSNIKINTLNQVTPMIYAYTTPEIARHNGWTKIGYTEQDVETRIKQQTHTANIKWKLEWRGNAIFDDGSGDTFKDFEFHQYLKEENINREKKTEWFEIDGSHSHVLFNDFRQNKNPLKDAHAVIEYNLRDEQERAVNATVAYMKDHEGGEYLWNAKPRFGKTLCVYDLAKKIDAEKVLVVTNRPAIANSWYSDFDKFIDDYYFVSNSPALHDKKYCVGSDSELLKGSKYIEFESLQDLKGSIYFGGKFDKYKKISDTEWDLLVVDEAHEGIDTYKTDVVFDHIKRKFTVHLSGTPFKALANDKFPEEAIFNWTYADEQKAKREWDEKLPGETNPYEVLPQLNMYTYRMSDVVKDIVKKGININDETEEYAFDLNEFFSVGEKGHFNHADSVERFLDALTSQEKFPFSTPALRDELKHTLWLLDRVDSAKELAKYLRQHPVFKDYEIIVAAGDGRLDDDDDTHMKAFDEVTKGIETYDKTITLSVGQLTTGVTIPQWTAVLMLSNVQSPSLYMQAAFRAQNPCLARNNGKYFRKDNAYVFDFDPARTLTIFEEFANDLYSNTTNGNGTVSERKEHIRELLNFFPVIGEDENGEMIPLDAEKVLTIPRKIKSKEVVQRGFMSNFLFQNIANIFHAPKEIIDLLNNLPAYEEGKKNDKTLNSDNIKDISVDENGDVIVPNELVIGKEKDLFGSKKYEDILPDVINTVSTLTNDVQEDAIAKAKDAINEKIHSAYIEPIIETVKENYGDAVKESDVNAIDRRITSDFSTPVNKVFSDYSIRTASLETEKKKKLEESKSEEEDHSINQQFSELQDKAKKELESSLKEVVENTVKTAPETAVQHIEMKTAERKRDSAEEDVRDHLRGFARTIPSFLMAYGSTDTTLENFDQNIPAQVFKDVTSISLDEFKMLRDGGKYERNDGTSAYFEGHVFDPIVFNDSVQEFLSLKKKLSNYFDEANSEDIFDYIPPQKTNQIYTPKKIVKQMVDYLEKENPGCFDDPDKTFIDLYMKSGLYIAEIVKRLFNSRKLKQIYPDNEERLNHIFSKQVYGLAPTEIIYRIACSFVLGFDDDISIEKNNLKQVDALKYAKNGKLEKELNKLYPDNI